MARSKKVRNLIEIRKQWKRAERVSRTLCRKVEDVYKELSLAERQEYNQAVREVVMDVESVKPKQQHDYWTAGDPNCPRDIKARNGELTMLRCKVCGSEDKNDFCKGGDK